mgnify:CR=1 FL=1
MYVAADQVLSRQALGGRRTCVDRCRRRAHRSSSTRFRSRAEVCRHLGVDYALGVQRREESKREAERAAGKQAAGSKEQGERSREQAGNKKGAGKGAWSREEEEQ